MKMSNKSPGGGSGAPQRCRLILQHCLAIQLSKPGHVPEDFWMYDSGYMIFQNFLAANAQCWWNAPLTAATRALKYAGHVAPGMLLVTAEPCALEVLRGAYARSVLKPPATYVINSVGDIDDCIVSPTVQGQFTPLPEALCDIIMDLTSQGHSATIENIRVKLSSRFPHMQTPTSEIIYDSLVQLMQEQKIYQTAKGYFIVTPERRRSRSRPRASYHHKQRSFDDHHHQPMHHYDIDDVDEHNGGGSGEPSEARTMLMTNAEAVHSLYGEISTERDGDLTHQCIQTNLADMLCGGNPNDKIIYARSSKRRSASFPTPRSLERRHSLRIFGSSKRLQRCSSTRSLSKNYAQTLNTDSSSSEYQSTDSSSPKKASLLSRLFRRSGRSKQRQIETFSAQFPPPEWFNSKAVHLHSVGTQTADHELPEAHTLSNSTFYDGSELSQRSMTLPRRHHRRHLSSESTFVISSRDCSPIRRGSPVYSSSSLPRSTHSIPTTSISTSSSVMHQPSGSVPSPATSSQYAHHHPQNHHQQHHHQQQHHLHHHHQSPARTSTTSTTQRTIPSKHLLDEKNRMAAARSTEIYRSPIKKATGTGGGTFESSTAVNGHKSYRSLNSGPSSYESGKASSLMTASGPSSIDSGKVCYSRTSGHSSIDSHTSGGGQSSMGAASSQHGSPKPNAKHYVKSRLSSETLNRVKSSTPNTSPTHHSAVYGKPPKSGTTTTTTMLPPSNSNSSITLQVTTSNESHIPSTKIFVQNTPVRSVTQVTLENGQLENSNVVIINNETTTNANGELIKRITKQSSPPRVLTTRWESTDRQQQQQQQQHHHQKQHQQYSETEAAYETGDSLSLISETSPDSSLIIPPPPTSTSASTQAETCKFTKNVNNDATMNNSRKLSLQIGQSANNIVYKNCLKDASNDFDHTTPCSPIKASSHSQASQSPQLSDVSTPTSAKHHHDGDGNFSSSTSNLRYFAKNEKKLNSNCDLKALHQQFETPALLAKLNSNPAINNSDSLAHMLHKNIVTVGSEPNLAMNETLVNHRKQNRTASSASATSSAVDKNHVDKMPMDRRRFSVSTTASTASGAANGGETLTPGSHDIFTFPSLTDLSFNFTSLAAQKILQGVSLNSIDTLVELNMAQQEKQQNVVTPTTAGGDGGGSGVSAALSPTSASVAVTSAPAICTDYGLV